MIRSCMPTLRAEPGSLWVMFPIDPTWPADADRAVLIALTTFVETTRLGEWEGQSSGEYCAEYLFWRTPGIIVHQFLFHGEIHVTSATIPFHEGQAMQFLTLADLDRYPIAFGFDQVCRVLWEDNRIWPAEG